MTSVVQKNCVEVYGKVFVEVFYGGIIWRYYLEVLF